MRIKRSMLMGLGIALLLMIAGTAIASNANVNPTEKVIIGFKDRPDISLVHAQGGKVTHQYGIINAVAAELPEQAIATLQKNPKVAYVEPDYEVHILEETLPWGVDRIDADVVHTYPNKGTGVKVAIIDTGIDYDHPDLASNYAAGNGSLNGVLVDPMDDNGHGTHCAGIVAAVDNELGVIGVAPEAELYAYKALNSRGSGYTSDILAGIDWAISQEVDVISMSFGSNTDSEAENMTMEAAYNHGILLISSAGNSGNPPGIGDNVGYPAKYESVIAVAATDINDMRARFSSTGPDVELAAPGVNIYSTLWDDTYDEKSGTSMACPHVAGVAALILSANSTLSHVEVREILASTAIDLGDEGKDELYGFGLVNAQRAVDSLSQGSVHDVAVTAISAVPSSVAVGTPVNVDITVENKGGYAETFNVTLVSDNATVDKSDDFEIAKEEITLDAGDSTTKIYTWNTADSRLGSHNLTATAELANDDYPADNSKIIEVEIKETSPEQYMHIADINMTTKVKNAGTNEFVSASAKVLVVDSNGDPVPGATVSGQWSGLTFDTDAGTTDINGIVILQSNTVKNPAGTFTFEVIDVLKDGWTYDPAANIETSDSISI